MLRNWFPLVAANLVRDPQELAYLALSPQIPILEHSQPTDADGSQVGVTLGTYALLIFCKVEKMCKEAEKEKGKSDTDSRQ